MRWPLKNQLLLRIVLLVFVSISALTFANIRASIHAAKSREIDRTLEITRSLRESRFPMTANVLEDMKALSGAEFIVTDEEGIVQRSTYGDLENFEANDADEPVAINIGSDNFYQVTTTRKNTSGSRRAQQIHTLVPRQSEAQVFWKSSRSPLLVAAIVLPIATLIAFAFASQITRPISTICGQTEQLSQGQELKLPTSVSLRNDEVGDLVRTMNGMAKTIKQHEQQLIANERLQTRIQVGNGIAHNLRNSSTGCQMAIELLATDHDFIRQTEEYEVARRQLGLIDDYIKRFLTLSKKPNSLSQKHIQLPPVALLPILESTVQLLRPVAKHLGVDLVLDQVTDTHANIEVDDARQVVMNLVGNAITAAKESFANTDQRQTPKVSICLHEKELCATLRVSDNGDGPPPKIADHIFESFVSGSKSGTGLGLVQVREIADQIGGNVSWQRDDGLTVFEFQFTVHNHNAETEATE